VRLFSGTDEKGYISSLKTYGKVSHETNLLGRPSVSKSVHDAPSSLVTNVPLNNRGCSPFFFPPAIGDKITGVFIL